MSVATLKSEVALGATITMQQTPDSIPYVQAATPIVCRCAATGTVDPNAVVSAIVSSGIVRNQDGVIVMNAALMLYNPVWEYYSTNKIPAKAQPYVEAVCDGLIEALTAPPALVKKPHIK